MAAATTTHASTQAHGGAAEQSPYDPAGAEFWVYAGLTIFILLAIFVGKLPKRITDALDTRIAETRRHLDEAKAVRADAERLLADARATHAASANDAATIIAHAEVEARGLIAKAEADAANLTTRRARMAEDKIAAAERAAIADVRARAADAAARAAAHVIAARHDAAADAALVDRAITSIR